MTEYYNRDGTPMEMMEWAKVFENPAQKRVAEDTVNGYWVSTVWLGLNHQWDPNGPPLIFETMVFPVGKPEGGRTEGAPDLGDERFCRRYSTEAEALAAHELVVERIRSGASLEEVLV